MIRNSFGRALAATGALVAFVTLGATAAMAQTTDPVNDAFASSQTKMSGYVTTGIGVIITLLLLGVGVAVLVKYVRKAAKAA